MKNFKIKVENTIENLNKLLNYVNKQGDIITKADDFNEYIIGYSIGQALTGINLSEFCEGFNFAITKVAPCANESTILIKTTSVENLIN